MHTTHSTYSALAQLELFGGNTSNLGMAVLGSSGESKVFEKALLKEAVTAHSRMRTYTSVFYTCCGNSPKLTLEHA